MPIYKIDTKNVLQLGLKKDGFGKEFTLRDFFADNLESLLGVRFLEKEYQIEPGVQIDTLGIDEDNSPVIIEYKWKENQEIFVQGIHYLRCLRRNKKHFNLLVQSKFGVEAEVNWSRPRVILIAQSFSPYIKSAVQEREYGNIELKSYALYDGDILHIENEYNSIREKVKTSIDQTNNENTDESEDSTIYNLEYHLNLTSIEMQKSFQELRVKLLELPSVEEVSEQKSGITYRTIKSFTRLEFKGTWIQVLVQGPSYPEDTLNIIQDVTTHRWGYRGKIKFTPESDIEYIYSIIKASYNNTL
ncbi:MAG: hypothetical protein WCO06_05125 [Candidatus Roizmanbacteria bacterium]